MAQVEHKYPDDYYQERISICKKIICKEFPELKVDTVPWAMVFCALFGKVTVNKRFNMLDQEIAAIAGVKIKNKKGTELDWDKIEKGKK